MFNKFKDLKQEVQKEFVLKYYPLILRRQQEAARLSKLEFLQRYLLIKNNSKPELNGKLSISKPAYKRYLKIVENIYVITFKSEKTDYISRSHIEPSYSKLDIPKLHKEKYGYELSTEILNRFDRGIFEEIWEQVNLDTVWDNKIINTQKEEEKRVKITAHLLQKSGLLNIVHQTLTNVINNNFETELIDNGNLAKGSFDFVNIYDSEVLKYNGNLFLRELEKELECSYVQRKEVEEEFDRGLELHYTPSYERLDFFDKE